MRPARNADVAFVAADTVLALRAIQIALMAVRSGNTEEVDKQIEILSTRADELWKRFEGLTDAKDD